MKSSFLLFNHRNQSQSSQVVKSFAYLYFLTSIFVYDSYENDRSILTRRLGHCGETRISDQPQFVDHLLCASIYTHDFLKLTQDCQMRLVFLDIIEIYWYWTRN